MSQVKNKANAGMKIMRMTIEKMMDRRKQAGERKKIKEGKNWLEKSNRERERELGGRGWVNERLIVAHQITDTETVA